MTTTKFQASVFVALTAAAIVSVVAVSNVYDSRVTLTVMGGNATTEVAASSIAALPECATETASDCVYLSTTKTFIDLDGTAYLAPVGYFN